MYNEEFLDGRLDGHVAAKLYDHLDGLVSTVLLFYPAYISSP